MKEKTNTTASAEELSAERERRQFEKMTQTPIARLIVTLAVPTTLNMMVTSLYNLVDTYFVSGLGLQATGAVSVVLSLMSIIQAVGFTLGMGGGNVVSRLLGRRRQKEADEVSSSSFFSAGVVGLFITILGLCFLTPLMKLLGAVEEVGVAVSTLAYAKKYSTFILLSAPFMCMSFVLNNLLRAQGKATLSMVGLVTGAVINVVLDPILINGVGLGIAGAGIATCVSQVISFCILLFMFLSGHSVTHIRLRNVSKSATVYAEIIVTGFPSFCRQILASLCTVMLNWAAQQFVGAMAALGVVQKVFMLAFSIALGIGQGYQPVLGYNHSAGNYLRVRSAYLFTLFFSTSLMVVFAVVCAVFAPTLMYAFLTGENADVASEIGVLALRLQCICMPLLPLNFLSGITYQAVGNKAVASLLSCSRQGLFYLPFVIVLPRVWGLFGIQSVQALSDFCAFLFAIPFTIVFLRSLTILQKRKETLEQEKEKTD